MTTRSAVLAPAVAGASGALSIVTLVLAWRNGSDLTTFVAGNHANNWVAGLATVYCALVSLGSLLTGSRLKGLLYGAGAVAAFALIQRNLRADQQYLASVDRSPGGNLEFSQSN